MGVFVITGASSGIGAHCKAKLVSQGHEVVNVDYAHGDIEVNLADPKARVQVIETLFERYPQGIDGLLLNAGVGPSVPAETLWAINFFAPIQLAQGLRPLLEKKRGACCLTSSNTITNRLVIKKDWVELLTNTLDEQRLSAFAQSIPAQMGGLVYSSGKRALVRWMRRVSASWGACGVRINAVAPGNTRTPMTDQMTDAQKQAALLLPIPTLYHEQCFLEPDAIAEAMVFLLSPQASAINGTVLYADGGTDALLNPDDL